MPDADSIDVSRPARAGQRKDRDGPENPIDRRYQTRRTTPHGSKAELARDDHTRAYGVVANACEVLRRRTTWLAHERQQYVGVEKVVECHDDSAESSGGPKPSSRSGNSSASGSISARTASSRPRGLIGSKIKRSPSLMTSTSVPFSSTRVGCAPPGCDRFGKARLCAAELARSTCP